MGAPPPPAALSHGEGKRVLALDAALGRSVIGVVAGEHVLAERTETGTHGQAGRLAALVEAVLAAAEVAPDTLDLIAVTVGPGGFTGIRAALALAHGIGLGAGVAVVGVSVGEALAAALGPPGGRTDDGRTLWAAIDNRRGQVFLEREGVVASCDLDALPPAVGRVAVAGDAAIAVAGRLAARGTDVRLTDARLPTPLGITRAALAREAGVLPPRPALPLYVDPPAARLPAGGLRPPPVG